MCNVIGPPVELAAWAALRMAWVARAARAARATPNGEAKRGQSVMVSANLRTPPLFKSFFNYGLSFAGRPLKRDHSVIVCRFAGGAGLCVVKIPYFA